MTMMPTTTPGDSMMSITTPVFAASSLLSSLVTDTLADVRLTKGPHDVDGVTLLNNK